MLAAQTPSPAAPAPSFASPPKAAPAAAPGSAVHTSDIGFSYSLPLDWQVIDMAPMLPLVKQQKMQEASSDAEKKGINCAQVTLTARHGAPASVVVVVAISYECLGFTMTAKDLPGLAEGASEGIKQSFTMMDPVYGAYNLGAHSMWIERAQGTPKDHPELHYTVEMVCSLLKKGAVCWMAMARDTGALLDFEHGILTLDGDAVGALVPPDALARTPS